jgi:hypothetical protein
LVHLLGRGELQVASLLGDDGALGDGLQSGDELGLEAAGLLGVQITDLFGDIDERSDGLIVALFGSFLGGTSSTANLDREFFATGVTDEFTGLLLNVLGGTA